jgi:glycolate oxidase FAD binding subunit
MTATLQPSSLAELAAAVSSAPRVLAVGASTKPRMGQGDAVKISTTRLSGVTEYEPSEFVFTALAGTPLHDISATLAERGQYLPFDPPLLAAGATLGGTVASGLSGPGRFRFGGIRDFILGVRFVDGAGRLLRLGGKVVKNAAGFDVPKFFVGSLGRYGVIGEVSFKVFPRPASSLTLKLPVANASAVVDIFTGAANSRWEPAAIDLLPGGKAVCLRLGGPATALTELAREILARWPGETLSDPDADAVWTDLREFRWAHADGVLAKIALTPNAWPPLEKELSQLDNSRVHVSAGGNMAFVSLRTADQSVALDAALRKLNLAGVTLRGGASLWLGVRSQTQITAGVKAALDSQNRFPGLDE